jgi:predicted Zn-dependent protease
VNGAELLSLASDVLATAGVSDVELSLRFTRRGCARFGMGELGQHMELIDPLAAVRVAHGARVAEAVVTRLDREALVEALHATAKAARLVPETEGFTGFLGADAPDGPSPPRFASSTARCTPEERASKLAPVLQSVRDAGLVSAGVLETRTVSSAVLTTRGCRRAHDATTAVFKVWALETPGAGGAAGYGGQTHRDVDALALEAPTAHAIQVCRDSRDPVALDAGSYDVVLEPEAVAELLEWLGSIAFAAPEVEQGSSAVAGRMGETLTGASVELVEDPLFDDPDLGFGAPFDREGTWRRRVSLLESGRARGVLYDRACAGRMKAVSTGSALMPAPGQAGGVGAVALSMSGGSAASAGELVSGLDRGLYVARLNYVNGHLEPRRAVMTGLTRDGCFLVEKGRIVRAAGNLRFTDSLLEALARSDGMTRARKAIPTAGSDEGVVVAPAVRIRSLRFTGASQPPPARLADM